MRHRAQETRHIHSSKQRRAWLHRGPGFKQRINRRRNQPRSAKWFNDNQVSGRFSAGIRADGRRHFDVSVFQGITHKPASFRRLGGSGLRHFDVSVFGYLLGGAVLVFAWRPLRESVAFHAGLGGLGSLLFIAPRATGAAGSGDPRVVGYGLKGKDAKKGRPVFFGAIFLGGVDLFFFEPQACC